MPNKILAIANCRVSSTDQLKNNSLARQEESVRRAAIELNVEIVKMWSGSVSSKAGTNVHRKDLLEMVDYCAKNKDVKYVIFDEYDRFMRSLREANYFETLFFELGVKVWIASEDHDFNGDDAKAGLLRALSGFKAEGSNEERINKSISGQTKALNEGRYPFSPKPGYMGGRQKGIPEIHPTRGPALREVLIKIAKHELTPTEGLKELNTSPYSIGRSPIKMDKFRKIGTDPFYAGIVEINKQVSVRNEYGLHESLISIETHLELIDIFNNKKKNQSGPRKGGNPKYPLNSITVHDKCMHLKNGGKLVGFNHTNGKKNSKVYEKYRCRSCKMYVKREYMHLKVMEQFENNPLNDAGYNAFIEAIALVWKKKDKQNHRNIIVLNKKLTLKSVDVDNYTIAAIDPSNIPIKSNILKQIEKTKAEMDSINSEIESLSKRSDKDRDDFLKFAYDYIQKLSEHFLNLTPEDREKCKQIFFPAGFYIDSNKNVYTPEISPLIRLASKKKDLPEPEKSLLVRVQGL